MPAKLVPINGSVLRWALDDAGMTVKTLATATRSSPAEVERWMVGESRPSTSVFHKIANTLNRPESFFFLPRPPRREPMSVAFRTHTSGGDAGEVIAPEVRESDSLRFAQRVQRASAWVNERTGRRADTIPKGAIEIPPQRFASTLRSWLDWTFGEQTSKESTEARVNHDMRAALQDRGITVLHLSLAAQVVRGFSLPNDWAPLIAINTQDPYPARLFSYVHECAHLTLGSESFCLTGQNRGIERWCNRVAAAVLLPEEHVREEVIARYSGRVTKVAEVLTLRRVFRVSAPAIAIRLEELDLGATGLYRDVMAQPPQQKPSGGRVDPEKPPNKARVRLRSYGRQYVNTMLEAEESGLLDRPQVLDLLKVSSAELELLQKYSSTGDEG